MIEESTSLSTGKSPKPWKKLRQWFITGLLFLGPLLLTIWLVLKLFLFADGFLGVPIQFFLGRILGISFFQENTIHGIGLVALLALILLTGWFTHQYLGIRIAGLINKTFKRIPLINKVYIAILQISEALLGGKKEVFKQAVLVEYPRKGLYCIGFITQDTRGPIQEALEEDAISIFLPTTPNPTSGYLLFLPKRDVLLLDVSVEEAMKLIISAGAVVPERGGGAHRAAEMMGIPLKPQGGDPGSSEGMA